VTIIPRGLALGLTWTLPERDHHTYSEEQVIGKITMAMGGRVAEKVAFQMVTTGAGNDIEQATKLARKMVCEWGMSNLGPISLGRNDGNVFLGMEMTRANEFSESTQAEADREIRRILNECYDTALKTVTEHRAELDLVANALIEFETINGKDMEFLLSGQTYEEYRDYRIERDRLAEEEARTQGVDKVDEVDEESKPEEGSGDFVTDIPNLASTRDTLDEG
jgi:cell division protease FtsH